MVTRTVIAGLPDLVWPASESAQWHPVAPAGGESTRTPPACHSRRHWPDDEAELGRVRPARLPTRQVVKLDRAPWARLGQTAGMAESASTVVPARSRAALRLAAQSGIPETGEAA